MELKLNDSGEAVKDLQRLLNKLGSLLVVDGKYGRSAAAAVDDAQVALKLPRKPVADDVLVGALRALPEPSIELTAPGVTFIGCEEVSGPDAYRKLYLHPIKPTSGGITIGIGYDLKFVDAVKLEKDWTAVLPESSLARLNPVLGKEASDDLLDLVKDLEIPLPAAVSVFLKSMLPDHIGHARGIYPSLDGLLPHQRTALISLVFNRGSKLSGDDRTEMRDIQQHLSDARTLPLVANDLTSMTRLWDTQKAPGLIARRQREAKLWSGGFVALQMA